MIFVDGTNGYIVIGVDHHGNTASEPYRAEGFLCWWERPRDLSVALDLVAREDALAGRLDTSRVACLGFSLGGHTVLSILGAITEIGRFGEWAGSSQLARGPREFPDLVDWIEALLHESTVFRSSWERQSISYFDQRVVVAVALAPAPPVRAFTPDSLAGIEVPVTLMVGEADRDAPKMVAQLSSAASPKRTKSATGFSPSDHATPARRAKSKSWA